MKNEISNINSAILPDVMKMLDLKKNILNNYKNCCTRLERDFTRSTDEVTRLANTYKVALEEAAKLREKLDLAQSRKEKGNLFL